MLSFRRAAALTAILAAFPVAAQTITVDLTEDIIDIDPETATVADLPGPDGHISFSEAMIASNNTPGRQTIGFAIPRERWNYLDWYLPGRAVVHVVTGVYWRVNDAVTIDGRTQTAFTGDTNPDGWEVVLWGTPIYLNADNCTVLGLDSSSVSVTANGGRVESNTRTGIELFGGSGSLVKGNTGGYVQIDRSSNNVVVGNTVDRVRVLGWIANGQPAANNRIGGPSPSDRNHIIGLGTVDSHGYPNGFGVQLFDAVGTIIENNWIGLSPDGLSPGHPSTTTGILFDTENYDTTIRNNRIGGILAWALPQHGQAYQVGSGIQLHGSGSGVLIVGNTIGLNANDEPVLGSINGIASTHFFYPVGIQNVVIGGEGPGEGNVIAGHLGAGITIASTYSGVRISRNSIHGNGGPGIDLITSDFVAGVTPNDVGDQDSGGNGLQNFPVLAAAERAGGGTIVRGSFGSLASLAFTLEFFASPACDSSGHGQGKIYLGALSLTTDAAGNASFSATLPAAAPAGSVITATATRDATGDTSEFSACMTLTAAACPPDFNGDGFLDFFDIDAFLAAFEAGDPSADFNGDGFLDFFDADAFVGAFETGC